jgi:hypothetical protein
MGLAAAARTNEHDGAGAGVAAFQDRLDTSGDEPILRPDPETAQRFPLSLWQRVSLGPISLWERVRVRAMDPYIPSRVGT